MSAYSKTNIINIVSEETGFTKSQVALVIKKSIDVITDKLANGDGVGIRNFGTFEVRKYASKIGRNFNDSGSGMRIPDRFRVKFIATGNLKVAVEKIAAKQD